MNTKFILAFALCVAVVAAREADPNCYTQNKFCQNGGICYDNAGSFAGVNCLCSSPYAGSDCGYKIRECSDNPCQNGGKCIPASCTPGESGSVLYGQQYDCFRCECAAGWGGSKFYTDGNNGNSNKVWNAGGVCDTPLPHNDCTTGTKCFNGGSCTSINTATESTFQCACTAGWVTSSTNGWNCTVPIFNCLAGQPGVVSTCQNGGTCPGAYADCTGCNAGFNGPDCTQPTFCSRNTCQNGGTCVDTSNGLGYCSCSSLYVGASNPGTVDTFCTMPRACNSNPCLNGGTCGNVANGLDFSCGCNGLMFNGKTCNATRYCSQATYPCMNGATCQDINDAAGGRGRCVNCPAKIAGDTCNTPLTGCGDHGCANAGTCACKDKSSCESNGYDNKCTCGMTTGVRTNGYYADCGCNTTITSRCPRNDVQTAPGYTSGTQAIVEPSNTDLVCQNGGACQEHADGMYCSCRRNFWGAKCENYDNPCLNYPCQNGGRCRSVSDTAPNGGSLSTGPALTDRYWGYACTCKYPFYGKDCELTWDPNAKEVSLCADNQCQNGATCYARPYGNTGNFWFDYVSNNDNAFSGNAYPAPPYQCECKPGYSGNFCEIRMRTCEENPCRAGSYCSYTGTGKGYTCTCPCGLAGDDCEIAAVNHNPANVWNGVGAGNLLDFCGGDEEVCKNGGTCVNHIQRQTFTCLCTPGRRGTRCELDGISAAAGVAPSVLFVAAAAVVALILNH